MDGCYLVQARHKTRLIEPPPFVPLFLAHLLPAPLRGTGNDPKILRMSFDLQAILELGELDQKILRLRGRLKRAPDLAAPQRSRVTKADNELTSIGEEGKAGLREVKRLELEAKGKEAEVEKAQVSLNQVKNNEEYQALLRTIASRQSELGVIETKILEAYDAQESREEKTKSATKRLKSQQGELATAQGRVKKEEEAVRGELTVLEETRCKISARLSQKHLELYERLLKKLGDAAVSEVVNEICQGCFMQIRPEQVSMIRGANQLVPCADCGRILWGRF
jgi:predicted  nucleic acid-binding Zn-ribbon protein